MKTPDPYARFMTDLAYGIRGMEGNEIASAQTIANYWDCLRSILKRQCTPIPPDVAQAVKEVSTPYTIA